MICRCKKSAMSAQTRRKEVYDECAQAYASSNKVVFSLWQNCAGENDVDFSDHTHSRCP